MKLQFSQQICEESLNIKFHENPCSGSQIVSCGRTGIPNPIVAFRNCAKALKNGWSSTSIKLNIHQALFSSVIAYAFPTRRFTADIFGNCSACQTKLCSTMSTLQCTCSVINCIIGCGLFQKHEFFAVPFICLEIFTVDWFWRECCVVLPVDAERTECRCSAHCEAVVYSCDIIFVTGRLSTQTVEKWLIWSQILMRLLWLEQM